MTILRDLSIIWSLIHVLVLYAFLYEPRYPRKKTAILTAAAMIPWTVVNAVLYIILGPEKMAQILLITATLPSLVFFWLMAKHRDGRFFFTFCFVDTVSYGVIALTSVLDYYMFGNQYIFMFVSRLIVFPFMEFVAWRYLRENYHKLQSAVKKGWGTFAFASALFYVLLVLMSSYPVIFYNNPGQTPILLLALALMVMMYVTIFYVLYIQQHVFYAMDEDRRLNQQAQQLKNELNAEKEYVFQAKRYLHDLHHHGRVVLEYLEQGEVEQAKQYLRMYRQYLNEDTVQHYCENPTVNALLRITARRCLASDISFRIEGEIPTNIPMDAPELCVVLGNLLENACEACEKCHKASLHIRSEVHKGLLRLEIRNSVSGRMVFNGDLPQSTKKNGGVGLHSVITVLNRHDGMMVCKQEGNTFLTRVILPL